MCEQHKGFFPHYRGLFRVAIGPCRAEAPSLSIGPVIVSLPVDNVRWGIEAGDKYLEESSFTAWDRPSNRNPYTWLGCEHHPYPVADGIATGRERWGNR